MAAIDNNLLTKRLSGTTTEPSILRGIVFTLDDGTDPENANYLLAFPVESVLKIIPYPPAIREVEYGIGIADWGEQTVTVVDLRQKFLPNDKRSSESFSPDHSYRFLILLQTRTGELCGIPVEQSPTLIDIPVATIRPVPLSYRHIAGLSFASHMAVLPQSEGKEALKIFLFAKMM
ncbi:MAG: chemotaxis protein CheW [Hydrococcus sp. Prado102]|jgi:purine-binding chemotaxis protein CheW|nr:chemotaxis protein CheW [Hydrococcus sp. Prado102]